MGILGFLTGLLIIACFIGCAQYLRENKEGRTYDKETMSAIAADPKYTNGVRFFCWTVSLLVMPYVYSLVNVFDLPINSLTVLIGIPASIGLFFTAWTINKPDSGLHNITSFVFYFSLWLMPIDLAFRFVRGQKKSRILPIWRLPSSSYTCCGFDGDHWSFCQEGQNKWSKWYCRSGLHGWECFLGDYL
ncbi:hypothetical protein GF389_02635 [Candidatus Dojkabacteria bacterium]|nr:hypothetical protein [Candidatus Dojkabacteria bacterium]